MVRKLPEVSGASTSYFSNSTGYFSNSTSYFSNSTSDFLNSAGSSVTIQLVSASRVFMEHETGD
jgi:hypothetical protein